MRLSRLVTLIFGMWWIPSASGQPAGIPPFGAVGAPKSLRQLAEQGDAGAQFNLGAMYAKGLGVARDYAEAIRWYRRAAKQGEARANFNLGVMYWNGRGVPQDQAAAIRWCTRSAEQGLALAEGPS